MNEINGQYLIDPERDVAFMVVHRRMPVLGRVYVFRDQLEVAQEEWWRAEALVFIADAHPVDYHPDANPVNGIHWLNMSEISSLDRLDSAPERVFVNSRCRQARVTDWVYEKHRLNGLRVKDIDIAAFLRSGNSWGKEWVERHIKSGNKVLIDLKLPLAPGAYTLRGEKKKYPQYFRESVGRNGVGDASKAEVL